MASKVDPQVIFYLGPAGESKTRQVLRTIPAGPRSLIISLNQDPYLFRLSHGSDLQSSCRADAISLHGPQHVRVAGRMSWRKEVFGERHYDRIVFKDLPAPFCHADTAWDLTVILSRLAALRSADVIATLDFEDENAIHTWEESLPFTWEGRDRAIGFWINAQDAAVRYLRMPALEVMNRKSERVSLSESSPAFMSRRE